MMLTEKIRKRRLTNWLGHTFRMDDGNANCICILYEKKVSVAIILYVP